MKIAICNRNNYHLKTLKQSIYHYSSLKRMEIVIDCYSQGEQMLASEERYEIIFLSCDLSGENSFEIAKVVRRCNNRCAIIFISSDIHCISKAFKVNAFSFLIYPVKQSDLFSVLDDYFEKNGNNYPLWVKSGIDTVCLNTGEIVYLEANNKNCYVHLENEALKCNCTMAKIYEVLPKNHFLKINRAYIINTNYINKYNNNEVFLKNGTQLHISRNYLKDFKSNYRHLQAPLVP